MRKTLLTIVFLLLALQVSAQDATPGSAGTDFYFAVFDHTITPAGSPQNVALQVLSTGTNTSMNIRIDGKSSGTWTDFGMLSSQIHPKPLEVVHLTTTEPSYICALVKGSTAAAETMILPKQLLGSSYMLQGVPGALIDLNGTPTPTYSQFCVIGTANYTTVTIQSPIELRCVTTNQTVPVGTKAQFKVSDEKALLFQPTNYAQSISGVQVRSTLPVAVFQGNNLTRIPQGETWSDYTWEQARPTTTFGTEFIVPKSALLTYNIAQVTAQYDNTDVYCWVNGTKMFMKTLNAGESYSRAFDTGSAGTLKAIHLQTTKPACCYLYLTGSARNKDIGDPAMVEIAPIDNPSTDTRWVLTNPSENGPYTYCTLITCRKDNRDNILVNNVPITGYNVVGTVTDDYISYEMPLSALQTMRLRALQGGFSAYNIRLGKTAEASAFNIALPERPEPQDLCLDGQLLFREDFGGNDPSDPRVSTTPVQGMTYQQLTSDAFGGMGSGRYLVTKQGYRNSSNPNYSVWHIMDDHTHFGDYERGYFMEIDGRGDDAAFYTTTLDGLCSGSKLSFSAWTANLTTAAQYNVWRYDREYVHPKLSFVISDPATNEIIAQYNTDTIAHDWSLFNTPSAWKQTANWQQVGMNFIVPDGVSAVRLTIRNAVRSNAAGNDFALDDIEVRLCAPPVTILAPDTVCIDTKNTFIAEFENDGTFLEPLEYQWYFSADSLTWTPLNDGNAQELKLKAKPRHTGWYRVAVAGQGGIENTHCRVTSEPHHLYVIEDCPPILCPDGILLFREDFGGNDPADPRVGQTPVPGMTYQQLLEDRFGVMRSGRYLLTKSGYCNGDTTQANLPQNRRSQWHLQDDHTYPDDRTRGYLLEIDGKGDNAAFYSTTIDGLCAGSDLSFIAYVANVMTWGQYVGSPGRYAYPRLLFRLTDPTTNAELGVYDTGEIPFDSTFMGDYKCWQYSSEWHQVGMNFTVPEGVNSIKLTIYNNSRGSIGNDFAIDDIEVRLCMEPIAVAATNPACRKKPLTLHAIYDNYGTLETPEYRWSYSQDSLSWTTLQTDLTPNYTISTVHKSHEGWYRVAVANAGNSDSPNCRAESEPFRLTTTYCNTAVDRFIDTLACDTLLEYDLHWRGHPWTAVGTVIDTIKDIDDDDSLHIHLTLNTQICCPEIQTTRIDSAVCDTLLPFLWLFRDTMVLFAEPGEQELSFTHARWENCIGEVVTLSLDTFHCERLYPIIVNKYNWQLLLDNVSLRRFFPERKYLAYQWYKNGEPISGANDDDYSETNELNGIFQLCIRLDEPVDNHDEYIWSNILEIGHVEAPQLVQVRIYDSHGFLMQGENLPRGVYLYHYEQGNRVWTEKRLIP